MVLDLSLLVSSMSSHRHVFIFFFSHDLAFLGGILHCFGVLIS
jgi:hypothetical protein